MMMMMKVPAENVKFVHITKYAKISTFPPKRMTRLIRGHNFELYWYNCNFFRQTFVVNCLCNFLKVGLGCAVISCYAMFLFFVSLQIVV